MQAIAKQMRAALGVFTTCPQTVQWLGTHDPMALRQAIAACNAYDRRQNSVLDERLYSRLRYALSQSGTHNPFLTMPYIEEELTDKEYRNLYRLLEWCYKNDRTISSGNYGKVSDEYYEYRQEIIRAYEESVAQCQ